MVLLSSFFSLFLFCCGKNDDKQLCYLLSLFCGLARKKKMTMVLLSFLFLFFPFCCEKNDDDNIFVSSSSLYVCCRCEKMTTSNAATCHHYVVVMLM
jgi:hypothetical protein